MKYLLSAFICFLVFSQTNGQSVPEIKTSTLDLMSTFDEDQRTQAMLPFENESREDWSNLPLGLKERQGLRFGDFSAESKVKFHRLLTTIFSSQGYLKTFAILQLDDILHEIFEIAYENGEMNENMIQNIRRLNWDYGNYFFAIWGNPEKDDVWGLKFEGHHLSLNLSVAGDEYSITPLFLGSDPAEVEVTQYAGLRPLSKEEDYGFWLINALSEAQKKKAILSREVPGDILTAPGSEQRLDDYVGIPANELNEEQEKLLHYIIEEFLGNLEHEKKDEYLAMFHAIEKEDIYFAWIGGLAPKTPHYYQINTPIFLIEYDNVGFLNNGNHIHAIWREKGNDFGEDILRKHRMNHEH
ncbi:DUF3500 domain-containing protein [Algoriphagus sediminis]|uniref:DUF3500 domain-containing protein n=1 Tax=Algoriphagus sediminis TaxID=3057113 RepID=A0ABT7YCA5_9BACT|nr:DUF3500 domain-containing protein [Algoriphagus sediminis]MDN3204132.1 DUF3500 domain-containing protein [Algoriphagus sediminis]